MDSILQGQQDLCDRLKKFLTVTLASLGALFFLAAPNLAMAVVECDVSPNIGQCICHGTAGEVCPSEDGVENGHDDHLAKWCCANYPDGIGAPDFCNFPTLDCACVNENGVQDTFGKCNGCGNGVEENNPGCCDPDLDPVGCIDPDNFCEECDDGNNVNGDGCDANCQLEQCGDGNIDIGEDCDGETLGSCQIGCTQDCECDLCGDGVVDPGEECDPGIDACCNNDCTFNTGDSCTDDDQNECTSGQCEAGSCVPKNNNDSCDDGLGCTENDACSGGACSGSQVICPDDGESCTIETCNEDTDQCETNSDGCECDEDSDCLDDGNPCTGAGVCTNFSCTYPPVEAGTSCADNLFCNGNEVCDANGTCQPGSDPCVGGAECDNECNEANDNCHVPSGTVCTDEGNECTDNECDGQGQCAAINNNDPCDDGDACSENDVCGGGACQPGPQKDCSDGLDCTTDSCIGDGMCFSTPTGTCECETDEDCDFGNPCAVGTCEENFTCTQTIREGESCADDDFCDGSEVCDAQGACVGDPVDCSDSDPCTVDSCNEDDDLCENILDTQIPGCEPPACPEGDADNDGVCDGEDNCPITSNPDQRDDDQNGVGNVCEPPQAGGEAECAGPTGQITGNKPGSCGSNPCANLNAGTFDPRAMAFWLTLLLGPGLLAGLLRRRARRNG